MATMDDAKAWNPYHLASMADCGSPDTIAEHGESGDSAGAAFLRSVLVDVLERVEWVRESGGSATWAEIAKVLDEDGSLQEIADGAPDVYTHTRWAEFVDLAAYNEDPSELGGTGDDMTQTAAVCLYLIAERLARAIVAELAEQDDDEDTDEG